MPWIWRARHVAGQSFPAHMEVWSRPVAVFAHRFAAIQRSRLISQDHYCTGLGWLSLSPVCSRAVLRPDILKRDTVSLGPETDGNRHDHVHESNHDKSWLCVGIFWCI